MEEKFREIVQKAASVFMRCGLKSVTMDDVARELHVSKKTLYKYVNDKRDLLCKVMEGHCCEEKSTMENIMAQNMNAIDEIIAIGKHVSAKLGQLHSSIHYDMEKYYPEVWGIFQEYKNEYIYSCIVSNLEKGIKENFYRDNLHADIIAKLYLSKIDLVFDPKLFPPEVYNFADVYMELMRYHIRGIASKKGMEYLKDKVQKENLNFYQ